MSVVYMRFSFVCEFSQLLYSFIFIPYRTINLYFNCWPKKKKKNCNLCSSSREKGFKHCFLVSGFISRIRIFGFTPNRMRIGQQAVKNAKTFTVESKSSLNMPHTIIQKVSLTLNLFPFKN